MAQYFPLEESMYYHSLNPASDLSGILEVAEKVSNRYIADCPAHPFMFRAVNRGGFRQIPDGRYDLNLLDKYPEAPELCFAYVYGMLWSNAEQNLELSVSFYSPTKLFLNGRLIHVSDVADELYVANRKAVVLTLNPGWNAILIQSQKTASGFGCIFGCHYSRALPVFFMSPFRERAGHAGWIYSETVDREIFGEGNAPDAQSTEQDSGMQWFPLSQWEPLALERTPFERIFGIQPGMKAFAWASIELLSSGVKRCTWIGETKGPIRIWIDGDTVYTNTEPGSFRLEASLQPGLHQILVEAVCAEHSWGFEIEGESGMQDCRLVPANRILGQNDLWIYLGSFPQSEELSPTDIQTLYRLFHSGKESVYWRLDGLDMWVRPYLEQMHFAKNHYSMEVTLDGLWQAGGILLRGDIQQYVKRYLSECSRMLEYSLWDAEQYGFPSVNQKWVDMKILEDGGTVSPVMLATAKHLKELEPTYTAFAARVAEFMLEKYVRREDGMYYRIRNDYMDQTLWVDDLYMCIPFLCRYYKITGDSAYMEEAVKQMHQYFNYLFMSDVKIMAHVYNFRFQAHNSISWGRGNGWALLALVEILECLPAEHPYKVELLSMFNELSDGIASLQGINGMWHQIVTDPDSYEETSCTAMFACAFAKGIRNGWLEHPDRFARIIFQAWQALTKNSIDRNGNVHGICRGSRYSYSPEYYKKELLWKTNDPHGIGVVLMAGVEIYLLMQNTSSNLIGKE
jgi:rhamnogalacturonyl hydrolase YesR